jgi:hypothetical protein
MSETKAAAAQLDVAKVYDRDFRYRGALSVTCPLHGQWSFPPDSEEVDAFAIEHAACRAPAPRPPRPPNKSRRFGG